MQEALFLAHRIPYPPDKGDKNRCFHILRHLARRWRVHLGCLVDDPDDLVHVPRLREICAQVSTLNGSSPKRLDEKSPPGVEIKRSERVQMAVALGVVLFVAGRRLAGSSA